MSWWNKEGQGQWVIYLTSVFRVPFSALTCWLGDSNSIWLVQNPLCVSTDVLLRQHGPTWTKARKAGKLNNWMCGSMLFQYPNNNTPGKMLLTYVSSNYANTACNKVQVSSNVHIYCYLNTAKQKYLLSADYLTEMFDCSPVDSKFDLTLGPAVPQAIINKMGPFYTAVEQFWLHAIPDTTCLI